MRRSGPPERPRTPIPGFVRNPGKPRNSTAAPGAASASSPASALTHSEPTAAGCPRPAAGRSPGETLGPGPQTVTTTRQGRPSPLTRAADSQGQESRAGTRHPTAPRLLGEAYAWGSAGRRESRWGLQVKPPYQDTGPTVAMLRQRGQPATGRRRGWSWGGVCVRGGFGGRGGRVFGGCRARARGRRG